MQFTSFEVFVEIFCVNLVSSPSEKDIKDCISALLSNDMELIQKSKISGFMKLWLYQFYTLSHLSWPFMINDLDKSFSLDLQRSVNQKLKSWAGIGQSVENGLLFHSNITLVWHYFYFTPLPMHATDQM